MRTINLIATLIVFFAPLSLSHVENTNAYSKVIKSVKNELTGLYDDWWQNAVLYQIYPRSFKDSDSDGSGDIQGIIQKLDHLSDMGVDGIWLSPIYKSPQIDNGYDISDYRDIDPLYGNLTDLKNLLDEAHKRDIKVILDYVPNHTSDQHIWFNNSVNSVENYTDYYIWANATVVNGTRLPPNNWLSTFYGSAWEWNEKRQQYYYHQFAIAQPDLNYRNPKVVEEMKNVLKYWLDFGIDGFRMDAISTLFEDEQLRDEPSSGADNLDPDDPSNLLHIYTSNLNETYDMVYQWRELLDNFTLSTNGSYTRIMMTEVYSDLDSTMPYYMDVNTGRQGAHFTFNFYTFIMDTPKSELTAQLLAQHIWKWIDALPGDSIANWVLGNHDQARVATRLGVENVDALNVLSALLPGVKVTYQGEEIGQENGEVACNQGYDPQAIKNCTTFNETSRDFERTPFQWDATENAGFSTNKTTWLPVSNKYNETNLAKQNVTDDPHTHYNIFKTIVGLKKELKNISFSTMDWGRVDNTLYLMRRTDNVSYFFVYNVDDVDNSPRVSFRGVVDAKAVLTVADGNYKLGDSYDSNAMLKPRESVVFNVTFDDS
ncbi:hypothetical protein ABEB36_009942 [Hypothenemus hampei]|uniref:alpha-glucosidase n=1 Tax=Hypothenemus hampei TaxID=57062 RepID=A0ABD1EM37_HYPHA